jgi:hypothetical protein
VDDLDAVVGLALRISAVMAGRELESMREHATALAIKEDRVILRLRPYATFMTPSRRAYNESEFAKLTHSTGSAISWDAE